MARLIDPVERPWAFRLCYGGLFIVVMTLIWHRAGHFRHQNDPMQRLLAHVTDSPDPRAWLPSILVGTMFGVVMVLGAELQARQSLP